MKRVVLMFTLVLFASTIFAATSQSATISMSDAVSVTSTSVEHGKKLTLKEKIALKKAIKQSAKSNDADISKGLYILLAFVGLGWLAMGLLDGWSGNNWIICLVLTLLLPWIGGFIFSMIKMKDYY
jgi:hypothetical protein